MRIILILSILCSFEIFAAQKARIVVEKATVYSDLDLLSPIGHISFGKIIQVGDVKRKHGTVLPTVINGRVVYVKVIDLALEKDLIGNENAKIKATEHNVDITIAKEKDKLNENNFVQFTASTMDLGAAWAELSNKFDSTPSTLIGFKAIFEHRPLVHDWSWGFGLGYSTTSQENLNLSLFAAEVNIYYSLIRIFHVISAEIMAGGIFSGALAVQTPDFNYDSFLLGYQLGAQIRILPQSKIGFTAGAKTVYLGFSGLDTILIDIDTSADLINVGGIELYGALTYKF